MRSPAVRQLAPVLLRILPREQLALGGAAAVALVVLLPDQQTVTALQTAALGLSLAVATILDEPAAETANAAPPTLLFRRALTIALALPVIVIAWGALAGLSGVGVTMTGALTLQLTTFVFATLALAAWLPRGSHVAGPAVVLAFLTAHLAAPAWVLTPHPADPRWVAAWSTLTIAAMLSLLAASRDPAHGPRGPLPAGARGRG